MTVTTRGCGAAADLTAGCATATPGQNLGGATNRFLYLLPASAMLASVIHRCGEVGYAKGEAEQDGVYTTCPRLARWRIRTLGKLALGRDHRHFTATRPCRSGMSLTLLFSDTATIAHYRKALSCTAQRYQTLLATKSLPASRWHLEALKPKKGCVSILRTLRMSMGIPYQRHQLEQATIRSGGGGIA